ncbi:MAG: hypothetical protein J0M30_01380 [Chitinophagales bacterium]|nr:hypothetical protein [Chitinophagales bacterium]
MTRQLLTLCFFVLVVFKGQAQTDSLNFPDNAKLPDKFQKAIKEQTKEYDRLFYRDSATTKHYSVPFMLDKIDNDSNYHYIFLAEYWIAFHYKDIIPDLIKRLTNKKEVGLANSADLIIWERVQAKQMQFYGHGGISNDDLFTIAGRANRLLTEITGEDIGHVSMYSTQEQLKTLQQNWIKWLKKLK